MPPLLKPTGEATASCGRPGTMGVMDRRILAERLGEILGPCRWSRSELTALAEGVLQTWPAAIRLNRLGRAIRPEHLPFALRAVDWFAGPAFQLVGRDGGVQADSAAQRPAACPLYGLGAYYIQDASSLLAVALLDVRPGEAVCDVCASPGGKATAILDALGDSGALVANEAVRSRVPALAFNLARWGATRFALTNEDPERLAERFGAVFDAVLVDAPCSGQGLLGRAKQTERAFRADTIEHCAARQRRILDASGRLVRPGGRLVYSTCTLSWQENEQQVLEFLDRWAGQWRLEPDERLGAWQAPEPAPAGCYRLFPHRHGCAPAFAARLVRVGRDEAGRASIRQRQKRRRIVGPSSEQVRFFEQWGRWRGGVGLAHQGRSWYAWPEDFPERFSQDATGPEAAFCKGRTWFAAYALAMRRDGRFEPHQRVELDEAQVRAYLKGGHVAGAVRGWAVASHRGLAAGWVRGDGRWLKNQLPKPARLVF